MARPKTIKGKVRRCSVVITEDLLQKVQQQAKNSSVTASEWMRRSIAASVSREELHPYKKEDCPVVDSDLISLNSKKLDGMFGHLRKKCFGNSIVSVTPDSIEFHDKDGTVHSIGVGTVNFEATVREHIKKLRAISG